MVCNCAGDLLINPTSLIALTLPARLLLSHYPPFVYVRGQMLSPVGYRPLLIFLYGAI